MEPVKIISWIVVSVYAIVVAGWWARHILISLTHRLGLYVEPLFDEEVDAGISVIVPARNERDRIGGCVETLLRQGRVVREVIIVDDRSDDETAEAALRAARGDPRLRVLRVDALPQGWAGKAHACQRGGEAAEGDWQLFADADCRFGKGGLAGAVRYAEEHDADLLSLWLAADHRSFWEHMLIPLCGALILYWFPPLQANRRSSRLGYANGQFILIRREAYQQIGGHTCAKNTVIEDIPLAQHAKQSGLRLRTGLGPRIVAVRMYTNFHEVWNGWTRIFIGAFQRRWRLLVSVWSLIGGSLLPSVGAPLAAAYAIRYGWPTVPLHQAMIILLWLHFVALYSVSYRIWGLCCCSRRHLLLYPVSVVFVMAILLRAWWWMLMRRTIVWRGTATGSQTVS